MNGNEFKISYSPAEENKISKLTEQIYYEYLENIDYIKEGTITFKTIYLYNNEDNIEVKVFIINSTDETVNFDYLTLSIVNVDKARIITSDIDLSNAGKIPPNNARPYTIVFNKKDIINESLLNENCKVVVELKNIAARKSAPASINYMDEKLSLYEKQAVEEFFKGMPAVMLNNVNITPYKSDIDHEGNRYTILIVSNGYNSDIELGKLTLVYKNEMGFIPATKQLNMKAIIKANTTSVFKIILEESDIIREPFDPKKCEVIIK
jgi:SLAP domain-containing protein